MKEAIQEAAKAVEKLGKRLLPESPHHLSTKTLDEIRHRYPAPKDFWYTGASAPLQYTTWICNVERGILFTHPRFEVCDDAEIGPAPGMKVPSKGEVTVKKRMNLQDYQKRKKSNSPADLDFHTKSGVKPSANADAKAAKENAVSARKEEDKVKETSGLRNQVREDKPLPDVSLNGDG